jgi:hypothetical protein
MLWRFCCCGFGYELRPARPRPGPRLKANEPVVPLGHSFLAGVSAGVTRSILDIKKSAVSVVLNLVNPVLPRGGLEGGVNLGELIKLIVKVLDDVLHLNRG